MKTLLALLIVITAGVCVAQTNYTLTLSSNEFAVVSAEAAKRNLTPQQLLKQRFDGDIRATQEREMMELFRKASVAKRKAAIEALK